VVAASTLQTASFPPGPLGVSMMLTTDILVVQKIINYLIKYALMNCLISMMRNLLINDLICPTD
jgi:hypothetical protein